MDKTSTLAHALAAYLDAARLHGVAAFMNDNDMIASAIEGMNKSIAVFDADGPDGCDILIPFLQHPNPMVRMSTAQYLHPTRREIATPVLHDLSLMDTTEASFSASFFLDVKGEPSTWNEDGAYVPFQYDDTLYKEALERFKNAKI